MSQKHSLNIGDEFYEVAPGYPSHGYIAVKLGHGTHYWNGEKIVPKQEQKPTGGGNTALIERSAKDEQHAEKST